MNRRLILTPKVHAEALFIYADDSRATRVPVDDSMLLDSGIDAHLAELTEQEVISSVSFTAEMDDGEAESLAVALSRSLPLLSDDLAVARVAPRVGVTVNTTLELVAAWGATVTDQEVRDALRSLRCRANYAPPRSHKLRNWFVERSM
jgi:predicted nucleic acid-binding protein